MKKGQLLAELAERGVTAHPSWTVPELRSILVEQRQLEKPAPEEDRMKGLTKMTLQQLVEEAKKDNLVLPAKPTRGLMMRLLRDSRNTPGCTVMPFGRYKGWMYSKVPEGYIQWAMKEVKGNPNAHEDLVRFATWGSQELERRAETPGLPKKKDLGRDPEALAVIPPPPVRSDRGPSSSSEASWGRVTSPGGYARKAEVIAIDTDIADDLLVDEAETIRALENQLAALKKKTNVKK